MTRKNSSELIDLIIAGNSSQLELCDENLDESNIAKHLVAFANSKEGGLLIFGIDDDKQVVGLINPDIEYRITEISAKMMNPAITPHYYEAKMTGKTIAVVEIEPGPEQPYYFTWKGEQNYTIRSGKFSRKISSNQLQSMLRKSRGVRYELMPIPNSTIEDLDKERLAYFLLKSREIDFNSLSAKALNDLLFNLQFLTTNGAKTVCTVGGMLLFGKEPTKYLAQLKTKLMIYEGIEKTEESVLLEVNSALIPGYDYKNKNVTTKGSVEEIISLINEHIQTNADNEPVLRFPLKILTELLVNAFVHRSYSETSANVMVEIFSDRLEISSPGSLLGDINFGRIQAGAKATRNPLLYTSLAEAGYFDKNALTIYNLISPNRKNESPEKFSLNLGNNQVNVVFKID